MSKIKEYLQKGQSLILGSISVSAGGGLADWAPTGIATASIIKLTPTSDTTYLSGIVGGVEGRILRIINVGPYIVWLMNESTFSVAANRILSNEPNETGSSAGYIYPNGSIDLQYDSSISRWRVLNNPNTAQGGTVYPLMGNVEELNLGNFPYKNRHLCINPQGNYYIASIRLPINYNGGQIGGPHGFYQLILTNADQNTNTLTIKHNAGTFSARIHFPDGQDQTLGKTDVIVLTWVNTGASLGSHWVGAKLHKQNINWGQIGGTVTNQTDLLEEFKAGRYFEIDYSPTFTGMIGVADSTKRGALYFINGAALVGGPVNNGIIIRAISNDGVFERKGWGMFTDTPDYQGVGNYSDVPGLTSVSVGALLGIYQPSMTPALGDIAIETGIHYQNITGTDLGVGPSIDMDNWAPIPPTGGLNYGYITEVDEIEYDYLNNWLTYRKDKRNNKVGISYRYKTALGASINPIGEFQWGRDLVYDNQIDRVITTTLDDGNSLSPGFGLTHFDTRGSGNTQVNNGNNGDTITVLKGTTKLVVKNSAIASLTINLPRGLYTGQQLAIAFANTITTLTYGGIAIQNPETTITARGTKLYTWDTASDKWY
jgi:hypothetical protein